MLSGLDQTPEPLRGRKIEQELRAFEGPSGFEGPCEMLVAVGVN